MVARRVFISFGCAIMLVVLSMVLCLITSLMVLTGKKVPGARDEPIKPMVKGVMVITTPAVGERRDLYMPRIVLAASDEAPQASGARGVFVSTWVDIPSLPERCRPLIGGDATGKLNIKIDDRIEMIGYDSRGGSRVWGYDFRVSVEGSMSQVIKGRPPVDLVSVLGRDLVRLEISLRDLVPPTASFSDLWLIPCPGWERWGDEGADEVAVTTATPSPEPIVIQAGAATVTRLATWTPLPEQKATDAAVLVSAGGGTPAVVAEGTSAEVRGNPSPELVRNTTPSSTATDLEAALMTREGGDWTLWAVMVTASTWMVALIWAGGRALRGRTVSSAVGRRRGEQLSKLRPYDLVDIYDPAGGGQLPLAVSFDEWAVGIGQSPLRRLPVRSEMAGYALVRERGEGDVNGKAGERALRLLRRSVSVGGHLRVVVNGKEVMAKVDDTFDGHRVVTEETRDELMVGWEQGRDGRGYH